MNTPTAKEFLWNGTIIKQGDTEPYGRLPNDKVPLVMVEFAKLHVEAALKAVNQNVKLLVDNNRPDKGPGEGEDLLDYYECGSDTIYVSSSSILNAYPLNNIV